MVDVESNKTQDITDLNLFYLDYARLNNTGLFGADRGMFSPECYSSISIVSKFIILVSWQPNWYEIKLVNRLTVGGQTIITPRGWLELAMSVPGLGVQGWRTGEWDRRLSPGQGEGLLGSCPVISPLPWACPLASVGSAANSACGPHPALRTQFT